MDRETIRVLLTTALSERDAYWDALRALEQAVGHDIDDLTSVLDDYTDVNGTALDDFIKVVTGQ